MRYIYARVFHLFQGRYLVPRKEAAMLTEEEKNIRRRLRPYQDCIQAQRDEIARLRRVLKNAKDYIRELEEKSERKQD